jgi:hypothetical protein
MPEMFKIPKDSEAVRTRKNVMSRQKLKKKWDKHCKWAAEGEMGLSGTSFAIDKFSEEQDNFVRLLDEGVVVEGDGTPYAVIAKGALKEWYDNLPRNFNGYINKDHISGLDLGKFTKENLRVVEIGDDRYGIDVNVKLDHELYATKDLLHQMNRKALSAEFYYEADEYVKASVVTGEDFPDWYLIPKINAVSIVGYAVVDNPKNANSYDENLLEKASSEERNDMPEELKAKLDEEEKVEASAGPDTIAPEDEAPVEETEAPAEDAEVEAPAEETEAEEVEVETTEPTEETEEETDKVEASIEEIGKQLESFKAEIAEKDAKIAELEAKLAEKDAQKEGFENKLAKLLNFATTDEPTPAESAEPTPTEDAKDDYTAALETAFKGM